jgi:hypothetical protein
MANGSRRFAIVAVSAIAGACATYGADYGALPAPGTPYDAGAPSSESGDTSGPPVGGDGGPGDAGPTEAGKPATEAGPPPASCKAIRDTYGTGDGIYSIAGGLSVSCNMTLAGGGWLLIANVPLAPAGFWEHNATTYAVTTPITDLTSNGMLLPATVDGLGVSYSEVLFTNTQTTNWFTVDSASAFYQHNYKGTCGDPMVIGNHNTFPVTARSTGTGDLSAFWLNGCPNMVDNVLTNQGSSSCSDVFVAFDNSCSPSADTVKVRAYIR